MSESTPFIFASDHEEPAQIKKDSWKLFIVDDDKDIHSITKLALKDLLFKDAPVTFESAYSAKEAIEQLQKHSDFAIILLDIGMETADAGLEVANFIRNDLHDEITRIIIRTGQPGDVPEREIIDNFDINDYKSKTDLTIEKLFTTIRTAIAQYDQIHELALLNENLEDRVEKAISKQKEQQEKLFTQNRNLQMNELLSMIAHQWRQPLSCISAVASQLKISIALEEVDLGEFDEQLDEIEQYTLELSNTIDEFRTMYEPSQRSCSISLLHLLEKSAAIIRNSFVDQHIKISIDGNENSLQNLVTGELYQVMLNILKNAQEAFLEREIEEPAIDINVSEETDKIHIKITDNAGGIQEETLSQIFDPYFSTKTEKNGRGLGLHMSKSIVEQQCKGTILAQNVNGGSCFTIIIAKI